MRSSIPGSFHFIVPGPLSTLTGGFIYDRRIVEALWRLEVPVEIVELGTAIPTARERALLRDLPLANTLVLDGLCLPHMADLLAELPHRVIVLVHHPCSFEPRLENRRTVAAAERRALSLANGIIATSRHTARMLAELGVDPDAVRVVHPATDPVPLAAPPRNHTPRLLCVATLTHRKGHDLLLDALTSWPEPLTVELIGESSFEPDWAQTIETRIAQWTGPGEVVYRGALSRADVDAAFARADLFVFPSRYEGFGMAPLEAIRAGVPVLATRVGALPEALPFDAAHLVVPTREGLAEGLRHCLEPSTLIQLRHHARECASRLRTWEHAGIEFRDALRQLAAKS